jgi:hypothetical protein
MPVFLKIHLAHEPFIYTQPFLGQRWEVTPMSQVIELIAHFLIHPTVKLDEDDFQQRIRI